MRRVLKVCGAIAICLVLLVLTLRVTGFEPGVCRSPGVPWTCTIPGLWLKGNLVTSPVQDWSFTDQFPTIKVQTQTWYLLPHSVTTTCTAYDGDLYLTSTYPRGVQYPHGRTWNENVARDPHVRLKIGNQLFDRTLELVSDRGERTAVLDAKWKKYPHGGVFGHERRTPEQDSRVVIYRAIPD